MPGSYTLGYNVQNSFDNKAATKTRVVKVVDTLAPKIVLTGGIEYIHQVGTDYSDPGYEAIGNIDQDLTDKVQVSGSVNGNVPGVYYVMYVVSDEAGNFANITRTVIVGDA